MAMCLDGSLGGAQFIRNLLVDLAAHDRAENLTFTRCKGRHKLAKGIELVSLSMGEFVACHGALDGLDQLLWRSRFRQKIFRARLDGSHRHRSVRMRRQEDDW